MEVCSCTCVCVSSVEVPGLPVEASRQRLEHTHSDMVGGAPRGPPAKDYSIGLGVEEEMVRTVCVHHTRHVFYKHLAYNPNLLLLFSVFQNQHVHTRVLTHTCALAAWTHTHTPSLHSLPANPSHTTIGHPSTCPPPCSTVRSREKETHSNVMRTC